MPKVAYSEEERADIRKNLIAAGLDLMAKQGIQHTTIQQIYERVGISRTFFYTFFSTKEEFVVEMLYVQQPKIIAYTQTLMRDPNLSWRSAVKEFLHSCCYGERSGIAVLTIEEQQLIFRRLSKDQEQIFREKQRCLFGKLWDKSRTGTNCRLYQFVPDGACNPEGDSRYASIVCSGSSRQNH